MFLLIPKLLACFLTGLAIKIIDDILDNELDISTGKKTWCQKAGKGCFVYALLALALAASLDASLSITLFCSAYIIGMVYEPFSKQSLNLPSWLEILLISIICLLLFDFLELITSLTIILSIDVLDDLIDELNYLSKIKIGQKAIIIIVLILVAIVLDLHKTISVYLALPFVVYLLESRWNK